MCGLPERVELQTSVGTTGESRVTDQCVNYWRELSYRPVCELPERVELQTSVWTTRESRVTDQCVDYQRESSYRLK